MLLAGVWVAVHPVWLWDAIPYAALAEVWRGSSWVDAHAAVYGWVGSLPDFWREDLLQGHMHRASVAADPESLRQLGGFFHQQAGYTALLAGLQALGMGFAAASMVPNLLAWGVLAGVLYVWLRPHMQARQGWTYIGVWLFWALLVANPLTLVVMRISGPEALVAAGYVAGVWAALHRRRGLATVAWLLLTVVRPLSVVTLVPLVAWAVWCRRDLLLPLALAGVAALAVAYAFPNYPLAVVWQHSFGFPYSYPLGVNLEWTWPMFQATYLAQLEQAGMIPLGLWLVMVGATTRLWLTGRQHGVAVLLLVGGVLQTLVFPSFGVRYTMGLALALLVLLLTARRDDEFC